MRGFCALAPLGEGDCSRDSSGSWSIPSPTSNQDLHNACMIRCHACERCSHVSYTVLAPWLPNSSSFAQAASFAQGGLCSWYDDCDFKDMRYWWDLSTVQANWTTVHVRKLAIPPPQHSVALPVGNATLRIAIAALTFGTGEHTCDLFMWCQGANRLRNALASRASHAWQVDLVNLGDRLPVKSNGLGYCPGMVYIPVQSQLRRQIRSCVRKTSWSAIGPGILYKWQVSSNTYTACSVAMRTHRSVRRHGSRLSSSCPPPRPAIVLHTLAASSLTRPTPAQFMALTQYDLVLHCDNDVDIFPSELQPGPVAELWLRMVPTLMRSKRGHLVDGRSEYHLTKGGRRPGVRLLGMADHESPLNGGVLLLRPSWAMFVDGMRVLRRCDFNRSHGWDRVGAPRDLQTSQRYFSPQDGGSTRYRERKYMSSNLKEPEAQNHW